MPTITVTLNPITINVTLDNNKITVTTNPVDIKVGLSSITTANFVAADTKFAFNGADGNSYFNYNSSTSRLELFVNGVKFNEFG